MASENHKHKNAYKILDESTMLYYSYAGTQSKDGYKQYQKYRSDVKRSTLPKQKESTVWQKIKVVKNGV